MKRQRALLFYGMALFFGCFFSVKTTFAAEEITLHLHKRIFPDIEIKMSYDLDIEEEKKMFLSQTLPQNGANFIVYDLHQPLDGGEPKEIKLGDWTDATRRDVFEAAEKYKIVAKAQTAYDRSTKQDGVATVKLPRHGVKEPLYLILEVKSEPGSEINGVHEQSAAPKIFDPQKHKNEEEEIYLETLNYSRHPYFFNYGKMRGSGEMPLAGVEYVLYKLNDEAERLYLEKNELPDTWYSWTFSSNPQTDERLDRFISNEEGLVTTNKRDLPPGTYYFEEVKVVPGFEKNENISDVEVFIPTSWTDLKGNFFPATVNGEGICEMRDGKVPEIVLQRASPKIFHIQRARNRVQGFSFNNLVLATKRLPQKIKAGELNFEISIIALVLLALVVFGVKKLPKRPTKKE
ncbi:pilin N-terminal domain-containing protein [Enterococcus dispar]